MQLFVVSHLLPIAVLADLGDHVVARLVTDPVRREVVLVERAVKTDCIDVTLAPEGADAGTLLGDGEAGEAPLAAGVGARHAQAGQGGPLVEPVVLQGEHVHRALVAGAAQPLVPAAEVDAVDSRLRLTFLSNSFL